MNEIPLNWVFVERAIDDCIHGDIDDVLTGNMFLFKFQYINGNEVQKMLVSFFC